MKIIQLTQGSQAWLDYRRTMRNASETAAVLGVSPWCTPYQLWLLKTGRAQNPTNVAMQRGTDLEPAARLAYEAETGNIMQPLVLQDGLYSASLDGMTLEGDLIVEIKCPYRGQDSALWREVKAGYVPDHYAAQIQHQMMVSGATLAHLYVFDGTQGLLRPVAPIDHAVQRIRDGWDQFQIYLDTDTPPPLTDADTVQREDADWVAAATAFSAAKLAADLADDVVAKAREALVALAQHPKESGGGVSVTRFWKQGSVSYAKVPELKGIELDKYRGKTREDVRVSLN
ncbi:lambda-exonuclease family protein [Rhodoferax sp. PAMC 29310]|uniref:lambda-exonuclease family protein n=1 Tax=Rhodoferax sp. PAMC 29310 TaxID=2822760 RepID=UPI001B320F54|nr:YqaJ viral recombinase family protein [Rhodoferax sp. PAMC 29310]